jgi:transcriptional regulator with XRE-family HTH domain
MHVIWPKNKSAPAVVLLEKAGKYAEMLKKREVKSQAELARKTGVNKARITQIMNLLKLAPEIQDYLKSLTDPLQIQYFTEKRLRPITKIEDHQEQIRKFDELKRRMESKNQFTGGVF